MMGPPELNPDLPEGLRLEGLSAAEYQSWLASRHEGILEEERTRLLSEGNRKARRKAAAQARKGVVGVPPGSIDPRSVPHYPDPILQAAGFPDIITEVARLPDPIVEAARDRCLSDMVLNAQHTMDWMRVQALQGRIIDTATPEERAARDAAVSAESDRAEAEYASRRQA